MHRHPYCIAVDGTLGHAGWAAFEGLEIRPEGETTELIGDFDQAALYGVLMRIQALDMELLEVRRLDDE